MSNYYLLSSRGIQPIRSDVTMLHFACSPFLRLFFPEHEKHLISLLKSCTQTLNLYVYFPCSLVFFLSLLFCSANIDSWTCFGHVLGWHLIRKLVASVLGLNTISSSMP